MNRFFLRLSGLACMLLAGVATAQAQAPDSTGDFFPLRVGNTWTYDGQISFSSDTTFTYSILDTTSINGTTYYLHDFPLPPLNADFPIRKDSLGRVLQYRDSMEVVLFDFTLEPGEIYEIPPFQGDSQVTVTEWDVETPVGRFENSRIFHFCPRCSDTGRFYAFARGVGLVMESELFIWGSADMLLTDAVIIDDTPTSIEERTGEVPSQPVWHAVYPNPFSERLTVALNLPSSAYEQFVEVAVYDILGRRVRTLAKGLGLPARLDLTWDGLDEQGRRVAGGVYVVRVQAGSFSQSRPIMRVR